MTTKTLQRYQRITHSGGRAFVFAPQMGEESSRAGVRMVNPGGDRAGESTGLVDASDLPDQIIYTAPVNENPERGITRYHHGVGGLVGVAFIANDVAEAYARWQKELRTFSEP